MKKIIFIIFTILLCKNIYSQKVFLDYAYPSPSPNQPNLQFSSPPISIGMETKKDWRFSYTMYGYRDNAESLTMDIKFVGFEKVFVLMKDDFLILGSGGAGYFASVTSDLGENPYYDENFGLIGSVGFRFLFPYSIFLDFSLKYRNVALNASETVAINAGYKGITTVIGYSF